MDIAPNPFSPYILPHYNPFNKDEKVPQKYGTCIRIQSDIKELSTEMRLQIYTMLGDRVWSLRLQNVDNLPYYVWWDGRTSSNDIEWSGTSRVIDPKGNRMCRNGRYFAVLSARIKGKEKRLMKHIVLMK
jgi:hypothetical protein